MCHNIGLVDLQEHGREGLLCYSTRGATVPQVLFKGWIAAARVGGAGNAGRGASPTARKREGISF